MTSSQTPEVTGNLSFDEFLLGCDRNVFLTGPPNSGKSMMLRRLAKDPSQLSRILLMRKDSREKKWNGPLYSLQNTLILSPSVLGARFIFGFCVEKFFPFTFPEHITLRQWIDFMAVNIPESFLVYLRTIQLIIIDDIHLMPPLWMLTLDYLFQKLFLKGIFLGGVRHIFAGDLLQYSPLHDLFGYEINMSHLVSWWLTASRIIYFPEMYGYDPDYAQLLWRFRYSEPSGEDFLLLTLAGIRQGPYLNVSLKKPTESLPRLWKREFWIEFSLPKQKALNRVPYFRENVRKWVSDFQKNPKLSGKFLVESQSFKSMEQYSLQRLPEIPEPTPDNYYANCRLLRSMFFHGNHPGYRQYRPIILLEGESVLFENDGSLEVRSLPLLSSERECWFDGLLLKDDCIRRGSLLTVLACSGSSLYVLYNQNILKLSRSKQSCATLGNLEMESSWFPIRPLKTHREGIPCDALESLQGCLSQIFLAEDTFPPGYFYTVLCRVPSLEYITFHHLPISLENPGFKPLYAFLRPGLNDFSIAVLDTYRNFLRTQMSRLSPLFNEEISKDNPFGRHFIFYFLSFRLMVNEVVPESFVC